MPWQRLVADVGGELLDDGRPAYRQVVFTVSRQSGKTTLVLGWEVQRAVGWGEPQRIAYTAQTGQDARKKIREDQFPLLERHAKALGVKLPFHRTPGELGVSFVNGSRLIEVASSPDAGHGQTFDLAVEDELFADTDDRRDQALRPAMITRQKAQVLACSTMGTEDSIPWNALVERGRRAAETGQRTGIAYFEWSAPDGADPADPATWWGCMPALGFTIAEHDIRLEWEAHQTRENEFRRAYLNQQTKADDRVIPATLWNAVCDPNVTASGSVVFAIDATPERNAGSIVACSTGQLPVIEVVDHRRGNLSWMAARAAELAARHNSPVALEVRGPAGSLLAQLEAAGVKVVPAGSPDLVVASAQFFDAVVESQLRVRREPVLDAAAAAATRRSVGDAWAWGRRSTQEDVSPLIAASLALWASSTPGAQPFMIMT